MTKVSDVLKKTEKGSKWLFVAKIKLRSLFLNFPQKSKTVSETRLVMAGQALQMDEPTHGRTHEGDFIGPD